ncbi:MAG: type II toxin-antitoxin system RelB/DinJ family antitoxin [Opitutaceae bacterium]|nr:type II toxin-antitoxin system RelB/DinJ family antitoxin [Opitutaceae bacterium]
MAESSPTVLVRARVPARRKKNAEKVLAALGITPGQAVNMLYAQIERQQGLPFPVQIEDNQDILMPPSAVASRWALLDDNDYGYLKDRDEPKSR